jgi:hypothetical protein
MKDHYRTLGVPDNASEMDIKLAYRRLAKRYHPDVNAGAKGAEERFKEITEAYSILSDFASRRAYDSRRMRPVFYSPVPTTEKKDPRRKEYSEEDLEKARSRHKRRTAAHMARRKKILVGMIVTFILFISASGIFDNWIQQNREKDAAELTQRLEEMAKKQQQEIKTHIESMDSPFDSVFGPAVYKPGSKNKLTIYMPFSDAVICAVQSEPPFKTIRNEFIEKRNAFVMNEMPDGKYFIKLYIGEDWNVNKILNQRRLGGFTKHGTFLKLKSGPYRLNGNDSTLWIDGGYSENDTIRLIPTLKFDTLTADEFFDVGK